jgi:hypothetical protein
VSATAMINSISLEKYILFPNTKQKKKDDNKCKGPRSIIIQNTKPT